MRKFMVLGAVTLLLVAGTLTAQEQPQKPSYTLEEYNAYQAAATEKNPTQKVKLLDAFIEKYPQSTMMKEYVHPLYLRTAAEAFQAKNFQAATDVADRFLALQGTEPAGRFRAIYLRTLSYHNIANPTLESSAKENTLAKEALQILPTLPKPAELPQADHDKQIQDARLLMNFTIGATALQAKNYAEAAEGFRAALAVNPNDASINYRRGLALLQKEPADHQDGFWHLARAIALKIPGEAQVRSYLRNQLLRYQNTQCDQELDRQVNEIVALAAQSPERPADFKVASDADLQAARANVEKFLETLQAGGPEAKTLWLAVCGLEFPEVAVKVIEVQDNGQSTVLKAFRAPTAEEMEAATEANMEITVTEQPEASRVKKDAFVRFTGTLSGYQPEPFLLSWNPAKINPEDIPAEEAQPAKKAKRPPKKPSR